MAEHNFITVEAVKTAYRQTKDGMVVSFAIHPHQPHPELALAPVGTRVLLAVAEITDELPTSAAPARPKDDGRSLSAGAAGADSISGAEGTRREKNERPGAVDTSKSDRAKEAYRQSDDMARAVTRAAILCQDYPFQDWLEKQAPDDWMSPGKRGRTFDATEALRHMLNIKSRSEIGSNWEAYQRFLALETSYKQSTGQLAEQRG